MGSRPPFIPLDVTFVPGLSPAEPYGGQVAGWYGTGYLWTKAS